MESKFLNNLGLKSLDLGLVLFIALIILFIAIVCIIVLIKELCKLKKRYNKFCAGRNAKSLEEEIGSMFEENNKIREQTEKNKKDIRVIYHVLESTYQKAGLVRYDAFSQMGGKLSFSLALLNEKDNGFIINSVHGTDGCYTYSKEIKGGYCDIALGAEEQEALSKAMHKGKN